LIIDKHLQKYKLLQGFLSHLLTSLFLLSSLTFSSVIYLLLCSVSVYKNPLQNWFWNNCSLFLATLYILFLVASSKTLSGRWCFSCSYIMITWCLLIILFQKIQEFNVYSIY